MINPQVEERLKAAKPQLDAIVASIRGQQAADKIASAASRASRERGYTPSVRPTVTGSVSPQQYIDQVMSALQPQMQRTIEEAQRSASARLGQIGTYDSGFGQKLLSEQEANIRAQALANAVSQGLQYGNLDLARLSEAFGQQYSLANLANQIRQAQLSREQQERLAMLPYQQLTAAQRAELPLREAEITKMYKGEMTPDYRRLISDISGIDPVTGQPTFEAQQVQQGLALEREKLAQAARQAQAQINAALQRMKLQRQWEREDLYSDPLRSLRQDITSKVARFGLKGLSDEEKALAESLLGIKSTTTAPEMSEYATNQALATFLSLPIRERRKLLEDTAFLNDLAQGGVDVAKLFLVANWRGGPLE